MFGSLSVAGLRRIRFLCVVLGMGMWAVQAVHAQNTATTAAHATKPHTVQPVAIMPVEERLPYLRKLKAFLEADPLDMAEFERQFEVKFECRVWGTNGKICQYRTDGIRWPYAVFNDHSSAIRYAIYGDGSDDSLWINLMYQSEKHAYNCITGGMLQQVFTEPEWTAVVDIAKTRKPQPDSALVLALDGRDQKGGRISILTMGVKGCTGKLQITVHPQTQQ